MKNAVVWVSRALLVVVVFGPRTVVLTGLISSVLSLAATDRYPNGPQITKDGMAVRLTNYARLPASARGGSISSFSPAPDYTAQLGRVNFLRAEPANAPQAAARFFVNDLNRNLYILARGSRTVTSYINFQAVFPRFDNDPGYAGGLVTFAFHPGYATNGFFYTVHTEDPSLGGNGKPINANLPGLNVGSYSLTAVVNPPAGTVVRHAVLVEWKDTNIANGTFEGTAREVLRIGFGGVSHPMGDLTFNPLARPGDSDFGNLYIACGDGAAGEQTNSEHTIPQQLDALQGKILRITPDVNLRPSDELSENGRYRIPITGSDPNPFFGVDLRNLRKEVYAYGFRNPHRLSWDMLSNTLFVNDIGLASWEEVNIVHKGANYGYAQREGPEQLFVGGSNDRLTGSQVVPTVPFPGADLLTVTGLPGPVIPFYPVATYSHRDGDAISSGFVYRGSLMRSLQGKYIFGDITTGRIFYSDLADLISCDDNFRTTTAAIHEMQVVFDSPYGSLDGGTVSRRMFDIVAEEYAQRGGHTATGALPGSATATGGNDPSGVPYGRGRADIRFALGDDGEIYVLSKSDGMIRQMVASSELSLDSSITRTNGGVALNWRAFPGLSYRVQYRANCVGTNWTDVAGDVVATGPMASKTQPATNDARYYRVRLVTP